MYPEVKLFAYHWLHAFAHNPTSRKDKNPQRSHAKGWGQWTKKEKRSCKEIAVCLDSLPPTCQMLLLFFRPLQQGVLDSWWLLHHEVKLKIMDFVFCMATTQPPPLCLTWGQAEDAGTGQGSPPPYSGLSRLEFSFLRADSDAGTHGEGEGEKEKTNEARDHLEFAWKGCIWHHFHRSWPSFPTEVLGKDEEHFLSHLSAVDPYSSLVSKDELTQSSG